MPRLPPFFCPFLDVSDARYALLVVGQYLSAMTQFFRKYTQKDYNRDLVLVTGQQAESVREDANP